MAIVRNRSHGWDINDAQVDEVVRFIREMQIPQNVLDDDVVILCSEMACEGQLIDFEDAEAQSKAINKAGIKEQLQFLCAHNWYADVSEVAEALAEFAGEGYIA